MKAPDKIYLPEEPDVFFQVEYDKDLYPVEYIRKDALIEWAKEQKTLMQLGGHVSIDDVIDKLNSF